MIFTSETYEQKIIRLGTWHWYFAFLPVDVENNCKCWWCWVQRRGTSKNLSWSFEYRTLRNL